MNNSGMYNPELPDLSPEKIVLYDKMRNTNEIMFITGKAGSGKTYLLDYFIKRTTRNVAVVAPTGIAALNAGGQTIHSFFGLDIHVQDMQKIRKQGINYKKKEILRNLDILIIDEASMVRTDIMDAIDTKLQIATGSNAPFGGKRVILFGDLYQLPPVVESQVDRYLNDKYGGIFFFNAPVFRRVNLHTYELQEVFRQKDDRAFIGILNDVRENKITNNCLDALNARCFSHKYDPDNPYLTLAPRNETVSRINQERLNEISGQEYVYKAKIDGEFNKGSFPTEYELRLKEGAQIIMLKNDTLNDEQPGGNVGRRWVNGTLGIVSELGPNTVKVMINGVEHALDRVSWEKKEYSYDAKTKKLEARTIATFTQFPIRLAWALTIHKSQGQTYKYVNLDLEGGAFDSGQTYVALSRCVSLNNLYLERPITMADFIVNQEVVRFMGDKQEQFEVIESYPENDISFSASQAGHDDGAPLIKSEKDRKREELLRQLAALNES